MGSDQFSGANGSLNQQNLHWSVLSPCAFPHAEQCFSPVSPTPQASSCTRLLFLAAPQHLLTPISSPTSARASFRWQPVSWIYTCACCPMTSFTSTHHPTTTIKRRQRSDFNHLHCGTIPFCLLHSPSSVFHKFSIKLTFLGSPLHFQIWCNKAIILQKTGNWQWPLHW